MKKTLTASWLKQKLPYALIALALTQSAFVNAETPTPGPDLKQVYVAGGTLEDTLLKLSDIWSVNIIFPQRIVTGKQAPLISGEMSISSAINLALQGSGLSVSTTKEGDYTIIDAAPAAQKSSDAEQIKNAKNMQNIQQDIERITVTGLRRKTADIGLFGEKDILDVPFSVQSFSEEQIALVQSRTAKEIIELDPSIRSTTSSQLVGENYIIRGINQFTSENFVDGLPGMVPGRRNTLAAYDRVEVFKGPSTLLNGPLQNGNAGGVINFIPKRADASRASDATLDFESHSIFGASFDVNGILGDFDVRLFGMARSGETEYDNGNFNESVFGASIAKYTDKFDWALDVLRQSQDIDGAVPLIFLRTPGTIPSFDNDSNPYEDTTTYDSGFTTILSKLTYRIDDTTSVFLKGGYLTGREEQFGGLFFIEQLNGDGRSAIFNDFGESDNLALQAGGEKTFDFLGTTHQVVLRVDYFDGQGDFGGTFFDEIPNNLYNPVPVNFINPGFGEPTGFNDRKLFGIAVNDTIRLFDDRVAINAGLRFQEVEANSSFGGDVKEDRFSPAISFAFAPIEAASIYVSYIEGLGTPTLPTSSAANAGQILDPPVTEQIELGAKYRVSNLTLTAAIFQIDQPTRVLDPVTNIDDFNGRTEYQGFEVNFDARVFDALRVGGGFVLLDAEQTLTQDGTRDGLSPQAAPEFSASLYADYLLTDSLSILTRAIHTGSSFVDPDEVIELPSSTRIDLGASYAFEFDGRPTTLRLIVDNITDSNDWQIGRNFASILQPRTLRLSLSTQF